MSVSDLINQYPSACGYCGALETEPCFDWCEMRFLLEGTMALTVPVKHEGATEEWSPMADIKPIQGPELPPDEYAGFWEVIRGRDAHTVPSLVELVKVLSDMRKEHASSGEPLKIELYWRVP